MAKKILMIDDEPEVCAVVCEFLEKKGFRTAYVTDGKEGIKAAQGIVPDIILLDITMPKMDGFAVLEKLKKSQTTMSIPVIMLTGRGDEESKLKAARLYNEGYITKPFRMQDIESKIVKTLRLPYNK